MSNTRREMTDPITRRTTVERPRPPEPKDRAQPAPHPEPTRRAPEQPRTEPARERPSLRMVRDTRARVRQEERELRKKFEIQTNANVIDQHFRVFDATQGDRPDGVISKTDLQRVARGRFDKKAAERLLREDGVAPEEIEAHLKTIRSAARFFTNHPDRFSELETADGGDPDGVLHVNDVDRFTLRMREEYGPLAREQTLTQPTREERAATQKAYERLSDPEELERAFHDRDLSNFNEQELNALAALNAESPRLREKIAAETIDTVNNAGSFDSLPTASGFQLLLNDHVLNPKKDSSEATGARHKMQTLIDTHVDQHLDRVLEHREGDGKLELALKRFSADVQDMQIANPVLSEQFANAGKYALDGGDRQKQFTEIAQADDSWLEDGGRWVGGAFRDTFNFLAGQGDPYAFDPLGRQEIGRDFTRGLGEGLAQLVEGGTFFAAHPKQGFHGLIDTVTHPGKIVDHYMQAGKDEGAGFALGQLTVDALGFKGVGRVLTNARRGIRKGAPEVPETPQLGGTQRGTRELDPRPFNESRALRPDELAIWDRLLRSRQPPAPIYPPYARLPRARGDASGDFLQPNVPGYRPDPAFSSGMGRAIDTAENQLREARKNGDISPEQIRSILGGIGNTRRELAEDASRRNPGDADLRDNWPAYGRPIGEHPPIDYLLPNNRHRAYVDRALEHFQRHGATDNKITIEVDGVEREVRLSGVLPYKDGAQVWHPPVEDMRLLEKRGYELMSEVMNNRRLSQKQAMQKLGEANFYLMHGTPFERGSPASIESLNDAVMRARFGRTFPPKAQGVEPFWEAMFATPGRAGVEHFTRSFRSYYDETPRPRVPGVFAPALGATFPVWDERDYRPDT